MRVSLVLNCVIGPNVVSGLGKQGYKIANGLLNKGMLGLVYCHGVTGGCNIPAEKIVPFCKSAVKRKLLGLIDRLHKRHPVVRGRRRIEHWMDLTHA